MLDDEFSRTKLLIGEKAFEKLRTAKIAVFGVGGVGSFAIEALSRAGISNISLFDGDIIDITNINRQIMAYRNTIGMYKTEAMKNRIIDINPNATVNSNVCFYSSENSYKYNFKEYDYIIDAIDNIGSKIEIIQKADQSGVNVISCMGMGNKLDPLKLEVSDIYKTSVCPLAKIMRNKLKKLGIQKLKTVYSLEVPLKPQIPNENEEHKNISYPPGSISFVPSVGGLIIASEVIKDIINKN